jgi:hypothetical protein
MPADADYTSRTLRYLTSTHPFSLHTQVIERLDTVRVNRQGVPIEVALTQDMHHLGVARCLAWGIGQPDPALLHLVPAGSTPTCWMVQEYCDKHTLVVSAHQACSCV